MGEKDQAYHKLLITVNKTTGVIGFGELDEIEFWVAVQCRLPFGDTPSPNVATIGQKMFRNKTQNKANQIKCFSTLKSSLKNESWNLGC